MGLRGAEVDLRFIDLALAKLAGPQAGVPVVGYPPLGADPKGRFPFRPSSSLPPMAEALVGRARCPIKDIPFPDEDEFRAGRVHAHAEAWRLILDARDLGLQTDAPRAGSTTRSGWRSPSPPARTAPWCTPPSDQPHL